jgi:hypothetical protein
VQSCATRVVLRFEGREVRLGILILRMARQT